jgi:hypothetical protein
VASATGAAQAAGAAEAAGAGVAVFPAGVLDDEADGEDVGLAEGSASELQPLSTIAAARAITLTRDFK